MAKTLEERLEEIARLDAEIEKSRRKAKKAGTDAAMGCASIFVALPVLSALQGLVIQQLWGWFAEPLGAPHVTLLHAIGLTKPEKRNAVLERMAKREFEGEESRQLAYTWAFSAATYLLVLGIGYVVHWWMW